MPTYSVAVQCLSSPFAWRNTFAKGVGSIVADRKDRKSTRLNSSHPSISYAVFCLKKKKLDGTTRVGKPLLCFYGCRPHQHLHSFPTRRSSDLSGTPRRSRSPRRLLRCPRTPSRSSASVRPSRGEILSRRASGRSLRTGKIGRAHV